MLVRKSLSKAAALAILLAANVVAVDQVKRVAFVGDAIVKDVNGAAEVRQTEGWVPLQTGTVLAPGAEVRTSGNGNVVLKMTAMDSLVKLTPHTQMRLVTRDALPKRLQAQDSAVSAGEAVVRAVRGTLEVKTRLAWRAVKVGDVLPIDSHVRTRGTSVADLFFPESRTVFRLQGESSTRVHLDKPQTRGVVLRSVEEQPVLATIAGKRN